VRRTAALLAVVLALTGCTRSPQRQQITVLAASSLAGSFTTLARAYEKEHAGTSVRVILGASSALKQQVTAGAPADVIATASQATVAGLKGTGAPVVFVRNRLILAVPAGNPGHIRGLADLARTGLKVAVCAPQVPCGVAATRALAAAHLTVRPATIESDVKAVLTKVELGEVDAGLVYATDVLAAGKRVIGLPIEPPVTAAYPILTLRKVGAGFVAFVRSGKGEAVLAKAGFERP